jgi:hypothetical protein
VVWCGIKRILAKRFGGVRGKGHTGRESVGIALEICRTTKRVRICENALDRLGVEKRVVASNLNATAARVSSRFAARYDAKKINSSRLSQICVNDVEL